MKLSEGLTLQMQRLIKTGSYHLNMNQKKELRNAVASVGLSPLTNLDCGVCVRNALHNLNAYLTQKDATPKLQMKMVKNPDDMTFAELRKAVAAKGHKLRNPNKAQLIKILKDGE